MPRNLTDLLTAGEGTQLEFKHTISSAHRIARTLCAFANTAGGTLLIGVTDDKKLVGVVSEPLEISKIEQATDFLVDPPLLISYEVVRTEGGQGIMVINVPESAEKPHRAIDEKNQRTIYVRQRDKSVPTNQLILSSEYVDAALLKTPTVRTLLQYLRKNDHITADRLANLVNISDYRANKLLRQLAQQGLLLLVDKPRPARFSLKTV